MTRSQGQATVTVDSYVLGYVGHTQRAAYGRVVSVSSHGWVTVWTDSPSKSGSHQAVMGVGRFVIKGEPRPVGKRTDIPERFRA